MSQSMRVLFDTEEYVTTLKEGGVPDNYAHAMSRGLSRAFNQGVATSEDITRLEARMTVLEGKIDSVEANLNTKIDSVEKNLNTKIDTKIDMVKVWLYVIVALVALTNPVAMHIFKAVGFFH